MVFPETMKTFVDEKTQRKEIEALADAVAGGLPNFYLALVPIRMREEINRARQTIINGQAAEDTEIFRTHHPIFFELSRSFMDR